MRIFFCRKEPISGLTRGPSLYFNDSFTQFILSLDFDSKHSVNLICDGTAATRSCNSFFKSAKDLVRWPDDDASWLPCVWNEGATVFMAPPQHLPWWAVWRVCEWSFHNLHLPSGGTFSFVTMRRRWQLLFFPVYCLWVHLGMLSVKPQTSESYVVWQAEHLRVPVAGILLNYS